MYPPSFYLDYVVTFENVFSYFKTDPEKGISRSTAEKFFLPINFSKFIPRKVYNEKDLSSL